MAAHRALWCRHDRRGTANLQALVTRKRKGVGGGLAYLAPDSLHPYEWNAVAASLKWSPPLLTFL